MKISAIIERYLAQIAQLVEQRTENPCVTGSIPVLGIIFLLFGRFFAFGNGVSVQKKMGY